MNRDLTTGKPSTVLWQFCLPLFGSIIFQQLYNIADSLVAGKFIGEDALAAVGNSYEITLILIAFAFGTNIGCSVVVSLLFGGKRYGELKSAVSTTMIAGGVLCATLMVGGLFTSGMLLQLINTPANVMADSKLYLDIYMLGLPFVFFYNISTGVFSALGDSKTPFLFLAFSSTANIAMDVLFVKLFLHMGQSGVAGVAWATFLCQGVSCVLALIVMAKRVHALPHDGEKPALFSWSLFRRISAVAVPSILQQSFISVGNIIIQSIINSFGSSVMAGYSASIKLNNLVISSLTTLGNGISNYTAQNLGADRIDRIREGFRAGLKLVWMLCIPFALIYFFTGKMLVSIFMDNPEGEALMAGIQFLQIVAPFYFVVATKLVCDGILRGAGMMKQFMVATFTDLILRVVLAKLLSMQLGSIGIWMAWPIGWAIATVISFIFYRSAFKTKLLKD